VSAPSDAADPLIGQNINGYVVEGRLGEGGMGLVYGCLQPDIGKRAALKVLKPEVSGDPEIVSRLVAEARAVNAIRHRGIVDIFGYAKLPDGRQGIIMEFLEGRSLEDELLAERAAHRTMPVKRVLQVADEVLNALAAAHKAGVIHRDLKPSNIFLCRGPSGDEHVKLLDFGIARMGVVNQTKASVVLGTPSYMAPEQARGESVGPALDLYAMGIILFEMLTGRLPYVADNAVRVIYMHLEAPIPKPSSLNPALPGALDDIVTKLLAKRTHERFESAETLRKELLRMKVALSDPSAMTTIEEPIAPFDSTQPIERTFVRATTPARPTDLNQTGVVGPPTGAPPLASAAPVDLRAPTLPPAPANVVTVSMPGTAPTTGPEAPPSANAVTLGSAPSGGGVAERPGGAGLSSTGIEHAVRPSRGPVIGLGLVAVLVVAGGIVWSRSSTPSPAPPSSPLPISDTQPSPPPALAPVEPATPVAPLAPVEPRPPVEAPVVAVPPPSAKPVSVTAEQTLARRLERLTRRVQKAKAGGADTEVAERQLAVVRSKLATATTDEARGQLEAILDRIAEDLEAP
jgi:serine/threonine-protein kinase